MSDDLTAVISQVMSLPSSVRQQINDNFENSMGDAAWKLQNFTNFVPRQSLTRFLVRNELFQKVLNVQGSIVECGVFGGSGITSWLHLSSIFEPLNFQRRIIGFDTFQGFPEIAEIDQVDASQNSIAVEGALALDSQNDIQNAVDIIVPNMLMPWKNKVTLVRGDACQTIPEFVENSPEMVISLLYLDFDIYLPTVEALRSFRPRMPRGSVIVFDELNDPSWPGESVAAREILGIKDLQLQRFSYDTKICYAVL